MMKPRNMLKNLAIPGILCAGAIGFCGVALAQTEGQNYMQNNAETHQGAKSSSNAPSETQQLGNDINNYNQTGGTTNNPPPKPHVPSSKPSPQAQHLGNDIHNYNQTGGTTNNPPPKPHAPPIKQSPETQNLSNDIENYNRSGGSTNNPPPQSNPNAGWGDQP